MNLFKIHCHKNYSSNFNNTPSNLPLFFSSALQQADLHPGFNFGSSRPLKFKLISRVRRKKFVFSPSRSFYIFGNSRKITMRRRSREILLRGRYGIQSKAPPPQPLRFSIHAWVFLFFLRLHHTRDCIGLHGANIALMNFFREYRGNFFTRWESKKIKRGRA